MSNFEVPEVLHLDPSHQNLEEDEAEEDQKLRIEKVL
jgi:hypothetical protein